MPRLAGTQRLRAGPSSERVVSVYTMKMKSIGIREFREKLSSFLESSTPVAITRHGETVGFCIPDVR